MDACNTDQWFIKVDVIARKNTFLFTGGLFTQIFSVKLRWLLAFT